MYTEIIKIIEAGLSGDKEKILNYSKVLAENVEKDGNIILAKKLRTMFIEKKHTTSPLDSLASKPVDTETRMDIVNLSFPNIEPESLILDKFVQSEIRNFIDIYQKRDDLLKAGLSSSSSLLLYGPPGCGKTTTAQYIASATGLPLVTAQLDGLISSLLGSTAKNIRKIFDYASKRDCILFLDEFDVIAKLRDDKNELGELKRVVNSLIQNIDTFSPNSILIAATNHQGLLDPAIWRRFTKVIKLNTPNKDNIMDLLVLYLQNVPNNILSSKAKTNKLIKSFENFSHSDIETVIKNCIKDTIINSKECLDNADILKEIYIHKHHGFASEEEFVSFSILQGVTLEEIHKIYKIPTRKINSISQELKQRGKTHGKR